MADVTRKTDRRVLRTRTLLRDALMALIVERGYETITIQDITDRADVARATFYLHFKDKDELLMTSMEEVYDDLVRRIGPLTEDHLTRQGDPVDLIAFQHVAENVPFYRVMLSERGPASFAVRLRHYLVRVGWEMYADYAPELKESAAGQAIMHAEAGALIALISWWVENGLPFTAEEMAWMSHLLGVSGVEGLAQYPPLIPSTDSPPGKASI